MMPNRVLSQTFVLLFALFLMTERALALTPINLNNIEFKYQVGSALDETSRDFLDTEILRVYPFPVGVNIEIWCADDNGNDTCIGECPTNGAGKINQAFPLSASFSDYPDSIWFVVEMRNDHAVIIPGQGPTIIYNAVIYRTEYLFPDSTSSSTYLDTCIVVKNGVSDSNFFGGAVHILKCINESYEFYKSYDPTFTMPVYPVELDTMPLSDVSSANYFDMCIRTFDAFEREIIFHEYGHAIDDHNIGIELTNYISAHNYDIVTNPGTALSEGWAEFNAAAVEGNYLYPYHRNVENDRFWLKQKPSLLGYYFNNGQWVEGSICNVLWDLYDASNVDEEYSTITSGLPQQGLSDIWFALKNNSPDSIAGFYSTYQQRFPATDVGTRTRIRGIFESNGIVFNRMRIDGLPNSYTSDSSCDGLLYQGLVVSNSDITETPVYDLGQQGNKECRLQVMRNVLPQYKEYTTDITRNVYKYLFDEDTWSPNDANSGFVAHSVGPTVTTLNFFDMYPGLSTNISGLLTLEGERLALRVQHKDIFNARDSFYPKFITPGDYFNSAQWLNELGTLRRGLVDGYRPFLREVSVTNATDTHYDGNWKCGADLKFVADAGLVAGGTYQLTLTFSEPVDTPTTNLYGYDAVDVEAIATANPRIWKRVLTLPTDPSALVGLKQLRVETYDNNHNILMPFDTATPAIFAVDATCNGSRLSRDISVTPSIITGSGGPDTLHRFRVAFLRLDGVDSGAPVVPGGPAVGFGTISLQTAGLDPTCHQVAFALNGDTITDAAYPFVNEWQTNSNGSGGIAATNAQAAFKDGETFVVGAELTDDLDHKGRLPVYARIFGVGDTVPFMQAGRVSKEIMLDNFRPFV